MKVDTISTKIGDINVEYSSFTKGFYIKSLPDKYNNSSGLRLLIGRDNSFKDFESLENYVKKATIEAETEFKFKRKCIAYKLNTTGYKVYFHFAYFILNEYVKIVDNIPKYEYYVIYSDEKNKIGRRNIFGQLTYSDSSEYIFIDYEDYIFDFIKSFIEKFYLFKENIHDFFDKDKVIVNIQNSINNNLLEFNTI